MTSGETYMVLAFVAVAMYEVFVLVNTVEVRVEVLELSVYLHPYGVDRVGTTWYH